MFRLMPEDLYQQVLASFEESVYPNWNGKRVADTIVALRACEVFENYPKAGPQPPRAIPTEAELQKRFDAALTEGAGGLAS